MGAIGDENEGVCGDDRQQRRKRRWGGKLYLRRTRSVPICTQIKIFHFFPPIRIGYLCTRTKYVPGTGTQPKMPYQCIIGST